MSSENFETTYVSCGCNKCPHAADWGTNGLICYGVCNSIAVYDPGFAKDGGKVIQTVHGHSGRINCVRWLRNSSNTSENAFISASADGTAIIWCCKEKTNTYVKELMLPAHSDAVNVVDALVRHSHGKDYIPLDAPFIAATSSIDSSVKIWIRNKGEEPVLTDTLNYDSGFCLDLKLAVLPDSKVVVLACAVHDNTVHLYNEKIIPNETGSFTHEFEKLYILTGHDDWVRAVEFTFDAQNNLYLASASQDSFVRIYKISQYIPQSRTKRIQNVEVKEDLEIEVKVVTIQQKEAQYQYAISLETVLAGHEGWVYGVSWYNPYMNEEGTVIANVDGSGDIKNQRIKLLSSSMDKTLIIWSQSGAGAWIEEVRLGEVGGNTLGFYGGKFRSDGLAVFGHGYQGSFHMWGFNKESQVWEPKTVVGGHTGEVMDLSWDVKGNYVISVGSDQTTRLHAPWCRKDENKVTWHEMARPQIHGYDLTCVAVLNENKFASGAEEKVIRAFTSPNNFIDNFKRLTKIYESEESAKNEDVPQGASVPSLGLSNKPVFEQMKKEGFIVSDEYPDLYFSPIHLTKPPTEENLLQNTLWPEVQKLYGHGNEIYSLAARSDGLVLASSCKATTPEQAAIILWNAKTWLIIQKLMAHQLTVTQMAFSPDGNYLLSVSRDRRWSLFGVQSDGKSYQLIGAVGKNNPHTRVIWCCDWTCDSEAFVTGSRDGKLVFWSDILPGERDVSKSVRLVTFLSFPKQSVTAVAFTPFLVRGYHLLAVGLENGVIHLVSYADEKAERCRVFFDECYGHQLTVKRLGFRPTPGRAGDNPCQDSSDSNVIQMASCGSDHILKVYDIFLDLL